MTEVLNISIFILDGYGGGGGYEGIYGGDGHKHELGIGRPLKMAQSAPPPQLGFLHGIFWFLLCMSTIYDLNLKCQCQEAP